MSPSFSSEERERLIAELDKAKEDFLYTIDQLQSAIRNDLVPQDAQAFTRVVATLRHFAARFVAPADKLHLMIMERDL